MDNDSDNEPSNEPGNPDTSLKPGGLEALNLQLLKLVKNQSQLLRQSIATHRLSKEEQELLNNAAVAFLDGRYQAAVVQYKKWIQLNKTKKDIKCSKLYVVTNYMLIKCLLESKNLADLIKAKKILLELEMSCGQMYPMIYYAFSKLHIILFCFEEANFLINKGFSILEQDTILMDCCIPESEEMIPESKKVELKILLLNLQQQCLGWHRPDAICFMDNCDTLSENHVSGKKIFINSPAFNGMYRIICNNVVYPCHISFHIACWKVMKDKLSSGSKITDKDVLSWDCLTPNCEYQNSPSIIKKIIVYGEDGTIKACIEAPIEKTNWQTQHPPLVVKGAIKKQKTKINVQKPIKIKTPLVNPGEEKNTEKKEDGKLLEITEVVAFNEPCSSKKNNDKKSSFLNREHREFIPREKFYPISSSINIEEQSEFLFEHEISIPCEDSGFYNRNINYERPSLTEGNVNQALIISWFQDFLLASGPVNDNKLLFMWQKALEDTGCSAPNIWNISGIQKFLSESGEIVFMKGFICVLKDIAEVWAVAAGEFFTLNDNIYGNIISDTSDNRVVESDELDFNNSEHQVNLENGDLVLLRNCEELNEPNNITENVGFNYVDIEIQNSNRRDDFYTYTNEDFENIGLSGCYEVVPEVKTQKKLFLNELITEKNVNTVKIETENEIEEDYSHSCTDEDTEKMAISGSSRLEFENKTEKDVSEINNVQTTEENFNREILSIYSSEKEHTRGEKCIIEKSNSSQSNQAKNSKKTVEELEDIESIYKIELACKTLELINTKMAKLKESLDHQYALNKTYIENEYKKCKSEFTIIEKLQGVVYKCTGCHIPLDANVWEIAFRKMEKNLADLLLDYKELLTLISSPELLEDIPKVQMVPIEMPDLPQINISNMIETVFNICENRNSTNTINPSVMHQENTQGPSYSCLAFWQSVFNQPQLPVISQGVAPHPNSPQALYQQSQYQLWQNNLGISPSYQRQLMVPQMQQHAHMPQVVSPMLPVQVPLLVGEQLAPIHVPMHMTQPANTFQGNSIFYVITPSNNPIPKAEINEEPISTTAPLVGQEVASKDEQVSEVTYGIQHDLQIEDEPEDMSISESSEESGLNTQSDKTFQNEYQNSDFVEVEFLDDLPVNDLQEPVASTSAGTKQSLDITENTEISTEPNQISYENQKTKTSTIVSSNNSMASHKPLDISKIWSLTDEDLQSHFNMPPRPSTSTTNASSHRCPHRKLFENNGLCDNTDQASVSTSSSNSRQSREVCKSMRKKSFKSLTSPTDKIIQILRVKHPKVLEYDLLISFQTVRRRCNNSLSGFSINKIVDLVSHVVTNRQSAQLHNYYSQVSKKQNVAGSSTNPNSPVHSPSRVRKTIMNPWKQVSDAVQWSQQGNCVICLESLGSDSERPYELIPCKHSFHTKCILAWFKYNKTCPTCRVSSLFDINFPYLS